MRFWLWLLLGLGAAAQAPSPGLTATECFVVRDQDREDASMADLRAHLRLRNDSGQVWKNARIVVHLMDGYGGSLFNFKLDPIPSWKPREEKDASVWQPNYRGLIAVFKLGAEVDATADGKRVHFELPPAEASPSTQMNY